jgi:hypothetical protein
MKLTIQKMAIGGICVLTLFYIYNHFLSEKIDYNTQVKPILNKNCIACHGGVKKKAGFSVLFRSEALDTTESGKPAIIPGDAANSEFIKRLTHTDPNERMPYKEKPLKPEEIEILTKWVNQGAQWGNHWAYNPVQPVDVPKGSLWTRILRGIGLQKDTFVKNDIDWFMLDKLAKEKMTTSPQADAPTLLRRVSLDLVGMPLTVDKMDSLLKNNIPYETIVDSLLAAPQYGERWAGWWLDLARYSDTKGYERDGKRSIWKYRDWAIKAFNKDMPYDQFTIEQLAGDLLPSPTEDQLIATAFHRNTMTNDEGGTDNEEFRTAAIIDRVNTTMDVWQSTTFSCIQCHSHPYDPFKHEDYYKMMAFFNNTRDADTYDDYPYLKEFETEDSAKLEKVKSWIAEKVSKEEVHSYNSFIKNVYPVQYGVECDSFENSALVDTKWLGLRENGTSRLPNVNLENKKLFIFKYNVWQEGVILTIHKDSPNGEIILKTALDTAKKSTVAMLDIPSVQGIHNLYFRANNPAFKNKNKNNETLILFDWFAFREDLPGREQPDFITFKKDFLSILNAKPKVITPIMLENNAELSRKTHVFERGNWLVKGQEVTPDVPASLGKLPQNVPHNRLALARWIVSPDNPLAARTIVNRLWEQLFGYGLVETLEDMGTQGYTPSHPELLDWLSYRLMHDHKWSIKKLLKDIVTSATYRQSSKASVAMLEKDPNNRFLARSPRVRLSAEQVRDQMMAVSGLLSNKMYGKSVMPYQPQGIWTSPYDGAKWEISEGEDKYRRALYTYWKRTAPYPSAMMFDGSSREVCQVRRVRTNTPLQALVTLNDSNYIAASRNLSILMSKKGQTPIEKIAQGYRMAMAHDIRKEKLDILLKLYQDAVSEFQQKPKEAEKLIAFDNKKGKENTAQIAELAALTTVANTILNLDEFITKE